MKLYWMKTSEAFPDGDWLEMAYTCFDPDRPGRKSESLWDTYIGNVHQEPHGPQQGMWVWSMTVSLPGPRFPYPRNGKEAKRSDAGKRVAECYERMLRFYGKL